MNWINLHGLIFMAVILIPNMIFAAKCPEGFENAWQNKTVELLEQIGRFGCFGFMIVHIPGTWFGFPSDEAFAVYLLANTLLIGCYCLIWMICFRKHMPLSVRVQSVPLDWSTTVYRSSVVSFFTRDVSQR